MDKQAIGYRIAMNRQRSSKVTCKLLWYGLLMAAWKMD